MADISCCQSGRQQIDATQTEQRLVHQHQLSTPFNALAASPAPYTYSKVNPSAPLRVPRSSAQRALVALRPARTRPCHTKKRHEQRKASLRKHKPTPENRSRGVFEVCSLPTTVDGWAALQNPYLVLLLCRGFFMQRNYNTTYTCNNTPVGVPRIGQWGGLHMLDIISSANFQLSFVGLASFISPCI